MKISRDWLQRFFDTPLPDAQKLADALTFHAFEIETFEKLGRPTSNHQDDFILDVKVTPNRGHDALSHRGIAKELSAILNVPLNAERDPFAKKPDLSKKTDAVTVAIEDPKLCSRYIAGYIKGVKIGPSPDWLKKSLEAVGQQSINNIVDATNLVMFNTGQPLHAFDADRLGSLKIGVRLARKGEEMEALDKKKYELKSSMLLITAGDRPVGIAGIKGGMADRIDEATKDIVIEAATFDGVCIRRSAQALKLRTDASDRFQQVLSPELAAYGMQQAVDLILSVVGGEVDGFVDEYPSPMKASSVPVSTAFINKVLGTKISDKEVEDVFKRLGFTYKSDEVTPHRIFSVEVPFERLDLVIPEDLVEEVGRIIGYDKVPAIELPPFPKKPEVNANFYAAEKAREDLISQGYSEVYTSVFAESGERQVANKIGGERPYLRDSLSEVLTSATRKNMLNAPLFGLETVKLFEIGTVWRNGKEEILVGTVEGKIVAGLVQIDTQEKSLKEYATSEVSIDFPVSKTERYQPFSRYPFIKRDISLWVPRGTTREAVMDVLMKESAPFLVGVPIFFDSFEPKTGEKISYAFRLILQSFEKTLTDEEANAVMEKVYSEVKKQGWEVR